MQKVRQNPIDKFGKSFNFFTDQQQPIKNTQKQQVFHLKLVTNDSYKKEDKVLVLPKIGPVSPIQRKVILQNYNSKSSLEDYQSQTIDDSSRMNVCKINLDQLKYNYSPPKFSSTKKGRTTETRYGKQQSDFENAQSYMSYKMSSSLKDKQPPKKIMTLESPRMRRNIILSESPKPSARDQGRLISINEMPKTHVQSINEQTMNIDLQKQ